MKKEQLREAEGEKEKTQRETVRGRGKNKMEKEPNIEEREGNRERTGEQWRQNKREKG